MQGNDALNAVLPVIAELERLGVPYYPSLPVAIAYAVAWVRQWEKVT